MKVCIGKLQRRRWSLERMRVVQLLLQESFVDFLRVRETVEVDVEGLTVREVLRLVKIRLGVVVVVRRLLHLQLVVEKVRQRLIPVGLEESEASWGDIILAAAVELEGIEVSFCEVLGFGHFEVVEL